MGDLSRTKDRTMRCKEPNDVLTYVLDVFAILTIKHSLQVNKNNNKMFQMWFYKINNATNAWSRIQNFFLLHMMRNGLKSDTLDVLETRKSIAGEKLNIRCWKRQN